MFAGKGRGQKMPRYPLVCGLASSISDFHRSRFRSVGVSGMDAPGYVFPLDGNGRFLRDGWLGPTFDSADDQWRELRESLPLISAAIAAHGLLSLLVRKTCSQEEPHQVSL